MARIDINKVVREEEYTPQVGDEYEIGKGIVGKLNYPTAGLQKEVEERAGEGDLALCRLILSGLPDEIDEAQMSEQMPSVVVADFFTFALKIRSGLQRRLSQYEK